MASTKITLDMKKILTEEAKAWGERLDKYRYEGNLLMAEQAMGRQMEAEWLLGVFTGKIKYGKTEPKVAPLKAATKKPAPAKSK
jgi:hypothetical protein